MVLDDSAAIVRVDRRLTVSSSTPALRTDEGVVTVEGMDVEVGVVEEEVVTDEDEVGGGRRSSWVTSLDTSTGADGGGSMS
jgi:hypothetical protein